jgi:hypothetical protein
MNAGLKNRSCKLNTPQLDVVHEKLIKIFIVGLSNYFYNL